YPPPFNSTVDSEFGTLTDYLPSEWHLSPRAGFTWTIGLPQFGSAIVSDAVAGGRRRQPRLIVRGGVGEFRSPTPTSLVAAAQASTGLDTSESQIVCTGFGVPSPDWTAYGSDPGSIPATCVAGGPGAVTPARNVAAFAPGLQAPRAWRASLGLERSLTQFLRATMDASFARGVSQYGFRDLNPVAAPRFP